VSAPATYIGGGVFVRLTREQVRTLKKALVHFGGHSRNWQVFAVRPSEAENIIEAYERGDAGIAGKGESVSKG
jgi:hypothetical protein